MIMLSRKQETEKLKTVLKDLSESPELNEKSRKNYKEMLETIEVAEIDGVYLSYDVLRKYYEMTQGLKKTQDNIDTIYA